MCCYLYCVLFANEALKSYIIVIHNAIQVLVMDG